MSRIPLNAATSMNATDAPSAGPKAKRPGRSRIGCAVLLVLGLAACERSIIGPDGGHEPIQCDPNQATFMVVKVVDATGAPVDAATVRATNQALNRESVAQTNAQGTTNAIGEEVGQGTVTLRAEKGSQVSNVQQVQWTCGECHCTVDPGSVTLTLQ